MKTQIAVGQFIVGKVNAQVVLKAAQFDVAPVNLVTLVNDALSEVLSGKIVGIQPNTPVNKKQHVAEANAIVSMLNKALDTDILASSMVPATNVSKGRKKAKKAQPKFASRDEWANSNNSHVSGQHQDLNVDRAARNANVGRFQSHAITVAETRFMDLGEYPVLVTGIEWFNRPDRYHRLGAVHVQISEGYADVRYYDNVEKQAFWYDFCDFAINQFKSTFNPMDGTGELTLAIKEDKTGQLYVSLPKSRNDQDPTRPWDKLRCRDVRFGKPHSDNNKNLEAAISAYVRFFVGEFVQSNPANRHGIDEHCGSCKYNLYVPGYDNMDNEAEGYQNTLNTSDTIEMVQWGQEIPRRFCMVNKELVDLEVVKEINEVMALEQTTYYDEEGALRHIRENEIVMGGKAINKYVALKMGTADRCGGCSFYHNNSAKTEKQISKEKAEGAEYVAKYWSEQARPDRQAIQTLVHNGRHTEWVNGYPGEFETASDFRVFGVGGVVIYGSEEVLGAAKEGGVLSFIAPMEEENVIESRGARIIEIIHRSCNSFGTIQESTLRDIETLLTQKPEGLSARMEKRWDGAVARLIATIDENQPQ